MTVPGKGKILVMDDEDEVRYVVGDMLKTLGCEPVFASDSAEALAAYQNAARSDSIFDAVIAAGGYSNDPVVSSFEGYGFSGVFAKPYTMDTLAVTLRSVIS